MELQNIIHDALYDFVRSHIPHADLSTLDDVLLSYITGVLEDLGSQSGIEENFDVEVFVEMLEAYIPGFSDIDSVQVCEMMFNLASKLASARNSESFEEKSGEWDVPLTTVSVKEASGPKVQSHSSQAEGATAKVLKLRLSFQYFPIINFCNTNILLFVFKAPKKLVRYHGNQVVTTKGERYHLVKKDESEDMKKTYVSLKPARKYRFH
uniref:CUE domain containing 2 n=1 Tax=Astyanax mexicanus TaxID=7994 RepID=A0A3B1JK09_ASTMX